MKKFLIVILLIYHLSLLPANSLKVKATDIDTTVFINEFLPDGTGSDSGKEWIELYNISSNDIILTNWQIASKSISSGVVRSYKFTSGVVKAKSFFIISEFDIVEQVDFINVGAGKLNMYNSEAQIYLTNSDGLVVDLLTYHTVQEGKSLERKGPIASESCRTLQTSIENTLGQSNSIKDSNCWPAEDQEVPPVIEDPDPSEPELPDVPDINPPVEPPANPMGAQSSIVISEVYPSPNKNSGETEWLELYNQDILKVDISNLFLKERAGDGSISTTRTTIPITTLDPGSYLIIYEKDLKLSLNNSGDSIFLVDVNDTIVDNFKYDTIGTSISVARVFTNGSYTKTYNTTSNFVPTTPTPTPGRVNIFPIPTKLDIYSAKHLKTEEFVEIKGIINSSVGLISTNSVYLQDKFAGIRIHSDLDLDILGLEVGDSIDVIGDLVIDHDENYIELRSLNDITVVASKVSITPEKKVANISESLSMLVTFDGEIYKNYSTTFYLKYEEVVLKVHILTTSEITVPTKSVRDQVTVSGILIKDGDYYTIIPRSSADLKIFSNAEDLNNSEAAKNLKPSTLSSQNSGEEFANPGKVFGISETKNAGDRLFKANSSLPYSGSQIYPWPIYLTTAIAALVELLKIFKGVSFL